MEHSNLKKAKAISMKQEMTFALFQNFKLQP